MSSNPLASMLRQTCKSRDGVKFHSDMNNQKNQAATPAPTRADAGIYGVFTIRYAMEGGNRFGSVGKRTTNESLPDGRI